MTIQRLYKYGSLGEHSEALFSTPTVWFSPPSQLNDPFECRPWFTFDGTRDQIIGLLKRELRRRRPETGEYDITATAVSIYLDGRHRNPATWEGLRRDAISTFANTVGLYCLSAKPDSILMWSHYGRDHTGYCLEFEATDHTLFFGAAQQVRYSEDFPVVDCFNTPNDKRVNLIFLTKFSGWAYEEEWRIIDHDSGPGLREYPPHLLTSVIFGLRMTPEQKALIREWVGRRGHDVAFHEARQSERKFTIGLHKVN
jgi:hypothetical protein